MSRLLVGIGEFKLSNGSEDLIVTHALGSCIAVCIWDQVPRVAGLLHFLLPESRINPQRAAAQPAAFADTGIPLLIKSAVLNGMDKRRARVHLVGGAETVASGGFEIGKRNLLAARAALWRLGLLISAESVGGRSPRTVSLNADDGRLQVRSTDAIETL